MGVMRLPPARVFGVQRAPDVRVCRGDVFGGWRRERERKREGDRERWREMEKNGREMKSERKKEMGRESLSEREKGILVML